jgi:Methyltransferase domain
MKRLGSDHMVCALTSSAHRSIKPFGDTKSLEVDQCRPVGNSKRKRQWKSLPGREVGQCLCRYHRYCRIVSARISSLKVESPTSFLATINGAASPRRRKSRLNRAARKLARDPLGFFSLLEGRIRRQSRAFAADPVESLILLRERVADRAELRGKRTMGGGVMPWPPCPYNIDENWEQFLHEIIGVPWPCAAREDFWRLWPEVIGELEEREGVHLGRGAFAGWGDGEPGLARALWCLTHHLRPDKVVETGVARGITTRFLLEALERNGAGHLWSIDLPPPLDRSLHSQIGIAVPVCLRPRWSYVRGSSRRRLPALLARISPIDLFVHDSTHTTRNLLFELQHAWQSLSPEGVVVADDVDLNCGFHVFQREHSRHTSLVCHAEPLSPDYPRQDERGVFGVVRRSRGS